MLLNQATTTANSVLSTLSFRIAPPIGCILLGLVLGFPPQVFLFRPRFFIFATLGYYSNLGVTFCIKVFHFCQPLILFHLKFSHPYVFLFCPRFCAFVNPRLLFHPRFSLFSYPISYYSTKGFFTLTYPRLLLHPRLLFGRKE